MSVPCLMKVVLHFVAVCTMLSALPHDGEQKPNVHISQFATYILIAVMLDLYVSRQMQFLHSSFATLCTMDMHF